MGSMMLEAVDNIALAMIIYKLTRNGLCYQALKVAAQQHAWFCGEAVLLSATRWTIDSWRANCRLGHF